MNRLPSKCPICGGQVVIEYFGDYGRIHKINQDGTVAKRYKIVLYETRGADESIVYCANCHHELSKSDN